MIINSEDPSHSNTDDPSEPISRSKPAHEKEGFFQRLMYLFTGNGKNESSLRETIEEYIEEEPESYNADSVSTHERILLSNILALRDQKVQDVMVPRADIIAIDEKITDEELYELLAERQFSRMPVYRDTLDEVLGTVHIKDIMALLAQGKEIDLSSLITDIPIVSPALDVLDLLLTMRQTRRHMALVVDEYGGIDGLVTIIDVIENIIGEIDDEHDSDDPQIEKQDDGSVIADARLELEEFESLYGKVLNKDDHEESETLGGLVFTLAGRVPARGEILTHSSGIMFEVTEADPRRISKLRIRHIPQNSTENAQEVAAQ